MTVRQWRLGLSRWTAETYWKSPLRILLLRRIWCEFITERDVWLILSSYRGADKSLTRPGRKKTTATKVLTVTSHSKTIQKAVRPTRSPRQQWPPGRTKHVDLSIVFFSRVRLRTYQHPCLSIMCQFYGSKLHGCSF